jgi:hypothetical protein
VHSVVVLLLVVAGRSVGSRVPLVAVWSTIILLLSAVDKSDNRKGPGMDTGESPLRLASQGSAVHGQDLCAEGSYSTTENCDPNVMIRWTSTPVKNNNPLSAKSKAVVSSEKRVVQRELYCDGQVQETSRSPEKGSPTKVTATPTRRHFCRSPRCAANDPDYASPVQSQPRKFLRSKRHLLPGWQAPPSSKRKVEASPAGGGHHPSTSPPGLNYKMPQVLNDACMVDKVNGKDGSVSDNCHDSITKDVQLEPTDAVADIYQSDSRGEDQKEATSPSKSNSEHSVMHMPPMCQECEEKGTGVVQMVSVECTSWCEFEKGDHTPSESNCEQSVMQISADSEGCEGEVVDPLCMISMEVVNSCGDSEEGNSTPSVTICGRHEKEVAGTGQLVTIDDRECTDDDCLLHTTMAVADTVVEPSLLPALEEHQNSSRRGLFTVNDEACSDVTVSLPVANTVVDPSQLSGPEAHQNSSGRGLFTVSDEAYSDAAVSLRQQAASERKKPENWMSDTLIREAVTRLAPEGEGGVHVLVQAFESIMLMEEETHDTKPARLFDRPGVGTSKALQNFVADHGQVSPAVLRCSIGKVQAWDETMAATTDLVDAKEEEEVQEMTMAGCSDDSGSSGTAEPMEQHNKGWGPVFSALDAVPRSDDDVRSSSPYFFYPTLRICTQH